MWYVGIDWVDDHHDAAVVNELGQQVATIRVAHSAEGLRQLTTFLLEVATRSRAAGSAADLEQIACVVETTQGLLMTALLEAGFPVYPVNPKTLERRRAPAGAKTDALDAYLLAKKGRSDLADRRRLAPDSPLVQELKVLTHDQQDQDGLIQAQTRLVNQLAACLKAYYPAALTLFAKLQQPTAAATDHPGLPARLSDAGRRTRRLRRGVDRLPQGAAALSRTAQGGAASLGPAPRAAAARRSGHDPREDPSHARAREPAREPAVPRMGQLSAYDEEIQRLLLTPPDPSGLPEPARDRQAPRAAVALRMGR